MRGQTRRSWRERERERGEERGGGGLEHTHTHIHTLTHSLTHSLSLSLDLSHSLSPSLSFCSTNATTTCHHETTLTNAMTRLTSLRRIGVNLSKNCPTWSNGMPAPFLLSLTRALERKPRVLSTPLSTSQPLSTSPPPVPPSPTFCLLQDGDSEADVICATLPD